MSANKIQWANRPKIWSVSRRTLMNRCPRAWVLRYGFSKRRSGFNKHLRNISDWSAPWRLMQRALRGVIIERFETLLKNSVWIEKDLASKIRHRIIGAMLRQNSVVDVIESRTGKRSNLRDIMQIDRLDRLVEIACHRYHSVMKCKPMVDIVQGKISEWNIFSRLEKTKMDNIDVHLSPDIVWKSGSTWHLLRFSVQGSVTMRDENRLEHMAMVVWGKMMNGLPENSERYIVENLSWSRGKWNRWAERANQTLVDDAMKMIYRDMGAMIDLHERLGPSCDLSQIPLASSKRICNGCGHRDTCPGGEDLVRASLEQSALEMAKASQLRNKVC